MFKFLKEKLKGAISKFSKKAKEETKVENLIKYEEAPVEKLSSESEKGLETPEAFQKEVQEAVIEEEEKELEKERIEKEKELEEIEEAHEKKGFFERLKDKIVTTKISEERFEDLFSDLE